LLGVQRCLQLFAAKYIQHPFQVVDHRRQADLNLGSDQSA
jgi:hypothetical protein